MNEPTKALEREVTCKADHLIARFIGDPNGPTLMAIGSIHGNEPAGSAALRKAAEDLRAIQPRLHGRVFFIEGNTRALNQRIRFVDTDLNRHWTRQNLEATSPNSPKLTEDLELAELAALFRDILATAKSEVFAVDLHSTSARGLPFATVGDTLRNRAFAEKFPVTILLGIEEQLQGTMLEYLNNQGVVTLGFEAGQHDQPETIANHEDLLWLALVNAGIVQKDDIADFDIRRSRFTKAQGRPRIVEVLFRKPIRIDDQFEMDPGYQNFDPVTRGQSLARDRTGVIRSPRSGLLLMPLYQKMGEDGFFVGREVARFWLWLSKMLRHTGAPILIRILPGIWRDPEDPESLVVNTQIAKFFPLQIFHLLGYRKLEWHGTRLIVSRRRFDTKSPFKS